MAHKRVSLSLTPEVYAALDETASLMGVSRSSLVNEMLAEGLPTLSEFLRAVRGAEPSTGAAMRLRGASAGAIRSRLNALRDAVDELDPDAFELTPCEDRPAGCSCDYSTGVRVPPAGGCLVHGEGA